MKSFSIILLAVLMVVALAIPMAMASPVVIEKGALSLIAGDLGAPGVVPGTLSTTVACVQCLKVEDYKGTTASAPDNYKDRGLVEAVATVVTTSVGLPLLT